MYNVSCHKFVIKDYYKIIIECTCSNHPTSAAITHQENPAMQTIKKQLAILTM